MLVLENRKIGTKVYYEIIYFWMYFIIECEYYQGHVSSQSCDGTSLNMTSVQWSGEMKRRILFLLCYQLWTSYTLTAEVGEYDHVENNDAGKSNLMVAISFREFHTNL